MAENKMANKMKILYFLVNSSAGQFFHIYPYLLKVGGLVFVSKKSTINTFKDAFPNIQITNDIYTALDYDPDIIMYTAYHKLLKGLRAKSVMVFHGMELKGYFAIKKDWNKCEQYDLCLLYGDKILQEFKNNGWNLKYKIIGYPRFDYECTIDTPMFNNDRKIILVAPTWSNESLLKKFTSEVIPLSKKYNVIVKLHTLHSSSWDNNKDFIKMLSDNKSETLRVYTHPDLFPFMNISDMMITDYSGASCEFMYFNKPIIIADPDCIPRTLKRTPELWESFIVCKKPKELEKLVESQFKEDTMKSKREESFKKLVYNEENSTATERGIKAMENLLN